MLRLLLLQPLLAVSAMIGLALWPPASGAMMLVPLSGGQADAVNVAVAGGARLLGAGPVTRSVVVFGKRGRLASAAARYGVLLLAAPPALCGTPS